MFHFVIGITLSQDIVTIADCICDFTGARYSVRFAHTKCSIFMHLTACIVRIGIATGVIAAQNVS